MAGNNTLWKLITILLFVYTISVAPANGVLTEGDLDLVDKFRTMVEPQLYRDYQRTDKYLIAWIQASDMDLDKAKAKLYKAHAWRRENYMHDILEADFLKMYNQCPLDTNIVDRQGRPVLVIDFGKCTLWKLAITGSMRENTGYLLYILESLYRPLYQSGISENVTQIGILVDVGGGVNLGRHLCASCIQIYNFLVSTYESYYPVNMKYLITINTPSPIATQFQKPVPTVSHINSRADDDDDPEFLLRHYGLTKSKWTKELNKLISEDQLTQQFGGTRRSFNDKPKPVKHTKAYFWAEPQPQPQVERVVEYKTSFNPGFGFGFQVHRYASK